MKFVLVAGTTETATIDGISAAGENPALMAHTPCADAELVAYGQPVFAPIVPVSPDGCPTPGLVTRAVRDHVDFEFVVANAGLTARTAAPSVTIGESPGADIRESDPVPNARELYKTAREYAVGIPDDELVIAESIPGGTTTAMGVLRALGEDYSISSSLPANPLDLKREVVSDALDASNLEPGDLSGQPVEAVRRMGDPTLAVSMGLLDGALNRGGDVTLAGGTQMLAAATLARHAELTESFDVATTSFVADDDSVDIHATANSLDVELHITDPEFEEGVHVAMDHYLAGVAKEGVGMGGALYLAAEANVPMDAVRQRLIERYDNLVGDNGP
ncbi:MULTISPECIES: nicotinate mononucleotide-dependent phosphoribosyltransferase CobT [unclassified Haladaptatus]|uniref:nicotinate mononucleotide-dependent phosphoribosyltransferase CobT n=1 Tax=unclassified Haladaptatus TaxID=2622732 RepID=UPI00209C2932|nr:MULTISPECIES: TIGR00303 family protein [unclassified Haladaptatus]MCO8245457.1 TIGR00303 family protein [Haladaptatus sp. AB643]MCO8256569.1 TIGR00303 family protein [Haladaptatus sp. AB618]